MNNEKLRVVLLSCCAPCSAGAIKQLADGVIGGVEDFIVLFFNPNIFPESEYTKRMAEQIKYCESIGAKYAVLEYDHDAWRAAVRGFEDAPERGARCSLCFEYRFRRAVRFARENGYNAIASVLGVSRHKDQSQVDRAAQVACNNIKYLPIKWDENLRIQINRTSDFYRQNYCGCEFSIRKV
ncbi:MAG: epoxyqueuosine reductase QueH [Alphaproteobacteria bacterium]|nr:epoxyqueuosine reductase QueH [Alphaproteobacteria bacterium]MBQ7127518.1 epoxyqueuosine reductase QueH [Alphaproteobacteria bacterium]